MTEPALEIVVGTSPRSGGDVAVTLETDVAMVKSALLYADRVELISPGAAMISAVSAIAKQGFEGLVDVIESLDPSTRAAMGAPDFPPNFREMLAAAIALDALSDADLRRLPGGSGLPADQRAEIRRLVAETEANVEQYRDLAARTLSNSGADELGPAIDAGLVVLNPAGTGSSAQSVAASADAASGVLGLGDEIMDAFVALLLQRLGDPTKHLMLDELMSSIVRGLVDEGAADLSQPAGRRAIRASVGSGLVTRLPAFTRLDVSAVLGLRQELDEHLSRYRRAVARLSQQVTAEPFTDEVPAGIDDLMRDEVQPALDDLRDALARHRFVLEWARSASGDARAIVNGAIGTAVGMGIASVTDVTTWLAAGLGAVGAGGPSLLQAAVHRADGQHTASQHDLYYLYALQQGHGDVDA